MRPPTWIMCAMVSVFVWEVGVAAQFGILGGTDEFRNARGEATLVVTTTEIIAVTFDLD